MAYVLADDERLLFDTVRDFAKGLGLDGAQDRDRHDRYPAEEMVQAAGLGLLGLGDASSGLTATHLALAVDALATTDPSLAACVLAHNAGCAVRGDRAPAGEIVSVILSEEATGPDASRTGTRAVLKGDTWHLTGQKVWGINAEVAKHFVVLAQTPKGPTLFHVPGDAPGLARGANEPIMGLRSAGIRTVYLSDVAVGSANILGEEGQGLALVSRIKNTLRLGAAAALCGAVAGGLDAAARFAETRIQFQQPIGTYQAVSDGVTEIDVQLAAARSLVLAAAAREQESDYAVWVARAKAFAATMAIPMSRQAIRVQGGTGFMREGGTERFARDVRALQFLGDPVPLQKDVVKRHVMPDIAYPVDA